MSKQLRIRPSEIYEIQDSFAAYCFDKAVTLFGLALEERLEVVARKEKTAAAAERKMQSEVAKWLSSAETDSAKRSKGRFRDPMGG